MPVPLDKIAATSSTIVVISTTILVVILNLPILLLLEVAPDENCDVFLFQIFFSIALARAQGRGSV